MLTQAEAMGIRRTTVNDDVFEKITPESAYWIGFLMADGYVCDGKTKNSAKTVGVSLGSKDVAHLEKLKKFWGTNKKLVAQTCNHPNGKSYHTIQLRITSDKICSALKQYGVVPRKSHIAKVFFLEQNRDFWRGVIDRDGSIMRTNNWISLRLCGSLDLTNQFAAYISSFIRRAAKVAPTGNIYRVTVHGENALRVLGVLYRNATTSLDRKYDKAQEILNAGLVYSQGGYLLRKM